MDLSRITRNDFIKYRKMNCERSKTGLNLRIIDTVPAEVYCIKCKRNWVGHAPYCENCEDSWEVGDERTIL